MFGTRAPADPYTFGFESEVERVNGTEAVLEETYFYAESGGQPADRGTLAGIEVLDVQKRDGDVVHTLADPLDASAGESVAGEIDPDFRTYCMRAHTASHVLYGAGRQLLEELGYGGFDIGERKVRVDFATPTEINDDALVEFERLANCAVWDSRKVTWEEYPREEALAREEVAFNAKTEEGLGTERVRIVEVAGWDVAACGGTHVRNTREIGPVTVLGRSNPGEGLTRVEFAVGPTAIERRAEERRAALEAARVAQTRVSDLPEAIGRLRDERDELVAELEALEERLVDARLAELREATSERDGQAWLVATIEGLDANALADRAQDVIEDGSADGDGVEPDVVALIDADGQYLAVATTGTVDASAVVADVTDEFGGGGGGSPTVAQGGGLNAPSEAIVAFLRDG